MDISSLDVSRIINATPTIMLSTFVVVILSTLYFFIISIPRAFRTRYFSTVKGKITSSEVGIKALNTAHSPGERVQTFTIDIEYKYQVGDTTYSSTKRKWHEAQTSFAHYHDVRARRYPKGAEVTVYYNPKKPQQAVLETGFSLGTYIGILICTSAIGLLILLILNRV